MCKFKEICTSDYCDICDCKDCEIDDCEWDGTMCLKGKQEIN